MEMYSVHWKAEIIGNFMKANNVRPLNVLADVEDKNLFNYFYSF